MRKFSLIFSVLILLSLHIGTAYSQTTEFTFQGSLTTSGSPANGNYDFEFYLYDALAAGSQVGSVVAINNVAVANGVFSVKLNFGNQFTGANRFLEIRLRPTGQSGMTILSPRQPLGSAPYSIKSVTAENATASTTSTNALNLGGIAASQFVLTTDPRMNDARPPTAGSPSYVQNAISQQAAANFNISGVGTAGSFNAVTHYSVGAQRILSIPGTDNVFAGVEAGGANSSGTENAFFGRSAGASNTTRGLNAFFGSYSGRLSTGDRNSFFGARSGYDNLNGSMNSFFGYVAGESNTTGNGNSFVGAYAGESTTTGSSNSFFGRDAGITNGTGSSNTFLGFNAGYGNISGNHNTFVGESTYKFTISEYTYATVIGADARALGSNIITLGRELGQDTVWIPGSLLVENLSTGGSTALCRNAFQVISTCSSSARYKSNIRDFHPGIDLIRQLRPVSFDWRQDGMRDLGLVAEEVNKVEPLLTTSNSKGEVEGVKYDRVSVVLINAIKEQQAQIAAQGELIDALKKLVCAQNATAEVCRQ